MLNIRKFAQTTHDDDPGDEPVSDPIRDAFCILVTADLVSQGWDYEKAWQAAVFGWCNRQLFMEIMQ